MDDRGSWWRGDRLRAGLGPMFGDRWETQGRLGEDGARPCLTAVAAANGREDRGSWPSRIGRCNGDCGCLYILQYPDLGLPSPTAPAGRLSSSRRHIAEIGPEFGGEVNVLGVAILPATGEADSPPVRVGYVSAREGKVRLWHVV